MKSAPFYLGLNYWPASSGVRMWREFDAEEIDRDFERVAANGMDTLRIFPMWADFQPIREFPCCGGEAPVTLGRENDWNDNERRNPALLDPEMMSHMDVVVQLAEKHHIKLIVALLTAWMSGTLFKPAYLGQRPVFSDAFAIKWQMRYCREFAKRYAESPAILAWDFGNEQNCVDYRGNSDDAWVWTRALTLELKAAAPKIPVWSGMHGLNLHSQGLFKWGLRDAAESLDMLTTHPYAPFTPGCFLERQTDLRCALHAAIQSMYYTDATGCPTLAEETGTLGDSVLSPELSAATLRLRLYSLWSHGVTGCLWWCYSDFRCGGNFPYKRNMMENDGLGLFHADGTPKPGVAEMRNFRRVLDTLGSFEREAPLAAVLLSDLTEDWPSAFTTMALCIQAGITARFVVMDEDTDYSPYKLLLAPSGKLFDPFGVPAWERVLAWVRAGGTLYVSGEGVSLTQMYEVFGIVSCERRRGEPDEVTFRCGSRFALTAQWKSEIATAGAEVLAVCADGTPAVVANRCGSGKAILGVYPFEALLSKQPYALQKNDLYRFYRQLAGLADAASTVCFDHPECECIPSAADGNARLVILINHSRQEVTQKLTARTALRSVAFAMPTDFARIDGETVTLAPLQAAVLRVTLA